MPWAALPKPAVLLHWRAHWAPIVLAAAFAHGPPTEPALPAPAPTQQQPTPRHFVATVCAEGIPRVWSLEGGYCGAAGADVWRLHRPAATLHARRLALPPSAVRGSAGRAGWEVCARAALPLLRGARGFEAVARLAALGAERRVEKRMARRSQRLSSGGPATVAPDEAEFAALVGGVRPPPPTPARAAPAGPALVSLRGSSLGGFSFAAYGDRRASAAALAQAEAARGAAAAATMEAAAEAAVDLQAEWLRLRGAEVRAAVRQKLRGGAAAGAEFGARWPALRRRGRPAREALALTARSPLSRVGWFFSREQASSSRRRCARARPRPFCAAMSRRAGEAPRTRRAGARPSSCARRRSRAWATRQPTRCAARGTRRARRCSGPTRACGPERGGGRVGGGRRRGARLQVQVLTNVE